MFSLAQQIIYVNFQCCVQRYFPLLLNQYEHPNVESQTKLEKAFQTNQGISNSQFFFDNPSTMVGVLQFHPMFKYTLDICTGMPKNCLDMRLILKLVLQMYRVLASCIRRKNTEILEKISPYTRMSPTSIQLFF